MPTLSRTVPSILGPCLGQTISNLDNHATLPFLGQIPTPFRADLHKIVYPVQDREAKSRKV